MRATTARRRVLVPDRIARGIGLLAAIMTIAALVSGCNTFRGMGKDLENAGEAIQRAGE